MYNITDNVLMGFLSKFGMLQLIGIQYLFKWMAQNLILYSCSNVQLLLMKIQITQNS